jgi:hypothetical protein
VTSLRSSRWYWLTGDALTVLIGAYLSLVTPWPARAFCFALIAIGVFFGVQDVKR